MIHSLTWNTQDTYIYRAYEKENTLRFKFTMTVSWRGDTEFEAHAWNSVKLLWPEAPLSEFPKGMIFLIEELGRIEPRFSRLTGTFEMKRLKAYKRLFRSEFNLVTLRETNIDYNGVCEPGVVVWFVTKDK